MLLLCFLAPLREIIMLNSITDAQVCDAIGAEQNTNAGNKKMF
jgi:hypothetical protein